MDTNETSAPARSSTVLVLAGDLNMSSIASVREQLESVDSPCEIDLTGVGFIDSVAMAELLRLARRLGPRAVTLRGASDRFQRVLEMVGLQQIFTIAA